MDKRELLESIHIDVEDIIDEIRFSYQHSENYGNNPNAFNMVNDTGDWVMCCCPNHPESRPSFGISKDAPYNANCFFCGYLGTIDEIIEKSLGLDDGHGIKMLLSTYMVEEKRATIDIEQIVENGRERLRIPCLDEDVLNSYLESRNADPIGYEIGMSYMRKRGLSDSTLSKFQITVDLQNKCIVFPQRTRTGELRFIQKRKIGNDYVGAKFINDGSPVKKDIIFGLHFINRIRTTANRVRRVRLVESPTDALSNYEAGFVALALNGKILFQNQIKELLLAGIEEVDLMLDNDRAGREGTKDAAKKLDRAGIVVNEVLYPSQFFKDSNDLLRAGILHKVRTRNINLVDGIEH